jgi:hypothetical protein
MSIPWDKLPIDDALRCLIEPSAALSVRLSCARGALPGASGESALSALYVLACDAESEVRDAAIATLRTLPRLEQALTQHTHPKVLELVATVRTDGSLDEALLQIRAANDRTAVLIAERADPLLCELIADNHTRLLITPQIAVGLHANPDCPDATLERVLAFLRMNQDEPLLPPERPKTRGQAVAAPPPPAFDVEAEIAAALEGRMSPMLEAQQKLSMFDLNSLNGGVNGFSFDFKNDDEFSLDLLDDVDANEEVRLSIEKRIRAMSTGKKIKLAFLGNKEARNILIRDRSKMVASAVVKSGRLTDAEVLSHAGNRNMYPEILREIAANKEWIRKYPVQVALVGNPRTPVAISIPFVGRLQARDLGALSRNKNVSSTLTQMAVKMLKEKAN